MRKVKNRSNHRKFRFRSLFKRQRAVSDETDWITFETDSGLTKVSPRVQMRRKSLVVRGLAFACMSISIPLAGNWAYGKIFFQNDEFILKSLIVNTDGILSEARLAEIANVSAGMNLMKLDLGAIQRQIEQLPQVEKATVTREMPDRLNMIVRERIPVAWLSSPPLGIRPWDMARGYLLDSEGFLFRCLDLNDGMKSLPVVEVFKMEEPVEGEKIVSEGVRSGIKLLLESEGRFTELGLSVSEVLVRDEWSIECRYQNDLTVTFSAFDFSRGLNDLALILDQVAESGKQLATVNLVAQKNIPVTFAANELSGETVGNLQKNPTGGIHSGVVEAHEVGQNDDENHLRSILKGG